LQPRFSEALKVSRVSIHFKPGDVVRAKSGGPKMTVVGFDAHTLGETERTVECTWPNGDALAVGFFREGALEKYSA
jgi:uncharacterized protein YodC (DUF2158 family)